ncbi:molecular chaperone [Candidatus Symbiopectobacterium sp. 'North America']|nr:molecular chaperone [Candidatus Symbiopectobacterium sp. 'North America']
MKITKSSVSRFLSIAVLFVCSGTFAASSLLVWPIYQIIEAHNSSSALWLENRGNNTVGLQIRIMAWRQMQYEDRYADQTEVIPTPPFIKLEPGQRSMIRLMRVASSSTTQERAFRIVIDEIATPYLPQTNNAPSGVQFQMRYLLPLFLRGSGHDKPNTVAAPLQLHWRIAPVDGKPYLYLRNEGQTHALLNNVFWSTSPQGKGPRTIISEGFLGYVLQGQEMLWPLSASAATPGANAILYTHLTDAPDPVVITRD